MWFFMELILMRATHTAFILSNPERAEHSLGTHDFIPFNAEDLVSKRCVLKNKILLAPINKIIVTVRVCGCDSTTSNINK
jgi:hypothetical protein